MTTKPTVAEVLELHRIGHTIGYAVHCICDSEIGIGMSPDVFYRHQADMLAAAGYGDVAAAKAEAPRDPHEWIDTKADRDKELSKAWNKGYISGHSNAMRQMSDEPNAPTTPNPYRQEDDR